MTDTELLDQIEAIRAKNNVAHVALQRLALEVAPDRARALLREIVANDEAIAHLSRQLARMPMGYVVTNRSVGLGEQ